jgi:multisubunit Na+/H+ antiporter MnhC subunit
MGGLQVPMNHVLLLAGLLFSCGLLGLMLRRNIIFMLMSLEVMLNAAALAFVAAGARCGGSGGSGRGAGPGITNPAPLQNSRHGSGNKAAGMI